MFNRDHRCRLLPSSKTLSFDKRKGDKAQRTRALHEKVRLSGHDVSAAFRFADYESVTLPNGFDGDKINTRVTVDQTNVKIQVHSDTSRKLFAQMRLEIEGTAPSLFETEGVPAARIDVSVYGESEFAVQTMWNAVDDWVIRSSNFHSLFELYGHFTEPHPIFRIAEFKTFSELPIAQFAKHCEDFGNCSRHLPRDHLTKLFGLSFRKSSFLDLVETLRGYRYDIRCVETNVAMPPGKYMVAYPFALPSRKQMNFSVQRDRPARAFPDQHPRIAA